MPEAPKEFTPGEYAANHARKRILSPKILFTTGRILVKETFEDLALPPETRYEETSQYVAPELHRLGIILFKMASLVDTKEERITWGRALAINQAAQDNAIDIVAYDHNGRVEI